LPHFFAFLRNLPHTFMSVVDAADGRVSRAHAECAVACLHRGSSALTKAEPLPLLCTGGAAAASRIAFAEISDGSAEQFMHRQTERFPLDVPQRHVKGAKRMNLFAARRIKPCDVHLLPDRLDLEGILADERASALFQGVF
jgi:hypothetical protein